MDPSNHPAHAVNQVPASRNTQVNGSSVLNYPGAAQAGINGTHHAPQVSIPVDIPYSNASSRGRDVFQTYDYSSGSGSGPGSGSDSNSNSRHSSELFHFSPSGSPSASPAQTNLNPPQIGQNNSQPGVGTGRCPLCHREGIPIRELQVHMLEQCPRRERRDNRAMASYRGHQQQATTSTMPPLQLPPPLLPPPMNGAQPAPSYGQGYVPNSSAVQPREGERRRRHRSNAFSHGQTPYFPGPRSPYDHFP